MIHVCGCGYIYMWVISAKEEYYAVGSNTTERYKS